MNKQTQASRNHSQKCASPQSQTQAGLNLTEKPVHIGSLKEDSSFDFLSTSERLATRLLDDIPRVALRRRPVDEWPNLIPVYEQWAEQVLNGECPDGWKVNVAGFSQRKREFFSRRVRDWARQVQFALDIVRDARTDQPKRLPQPSQFVN
jgi:hypothetical protein